MRRIAIMLVVAATVLTATVASAAPVTGTFQVNNGACWVCNSAM